MQNPFKCDIIINGWGCSYRGIDTMRNGKRSGDKMALVKLVKDDKGVFACPDCKGNLEYMSGGAVRIVNGRVDHDNTLPRYVCFKCNKFYRELLNSGYYDHFDLEPELRRKPARKKLLHTGDLPPMQLKKDSRGGCECPRCGDYMRYVEGGAVEIINGRADMSNTVARFVCDGCNSVFRRIATTAYYQWCEK